MRKIIVPALILGISALAGAGLVAAAPQSDSMDTPAGMTDGPGGDGHGHHRFMMRHHWSPTEHLDGRLAYLKAELKIKPAQESAWSDFAAAARKSATIVEEARPEKPGGTRAALPVPARLDRAEERLTARLDALKALKSPTKKLYDSLDDTQKKSADELFHGPMGMMR